MLAALKDAKYSKYVWHAKHKRPTSPVSKNKNDWSYF